MIEYKSKDLLFAKYSAKNQMTYQIISTFDGKVTNCSLPKLSQNLQINSILCELGADEAVSDSWPLVHGTLVTFAVEFADYALKNYSKQKFPEAEVCITLTRKWLENHDSVSVEELKVAAHAAYAAHAAHAAHAAAHAAYAAAYAAYAAYAANAADAATAAADAATAAANAANAANAAAHAASYAAYAVEAAADAGKSREAEYVRQGGFIVEHLRAAATVSCNTLAA